jgi:cobalt-zinc-cadmium efflux system outer membrane protein
MALARARQRAPTVLLARDRIAEARGRLRGASLVFQENPTLELSAGPRTLSATTPGADRTTVDYSAAIGQSFELGGRRAARIAGAQAGVDRETARAGNSLRELLRDVSLAFSRGLAAQERLRLAQAAERVAGELLRTTERRYEVGDVPVLDVNLARSSAARARADVRAAEAEVIAAIGELRILLGMSPEEPLAPSGSLRDRQQYELEALLARAPERADLRALAAELSEAEAENRLGRAFRWPNVTAGFRFARDEGDLVREAGLTFTLPFFSRGQELQAVGQARSTRLRRELEASRRAVSVEIHTAFQVYCSQVQAVEELERHALPSLDENEQLARRSYEEGEIGLPELLLIRRENFDTRAAYIQRLLEAAQAGIELQARAGVLQ